MSSDVELEEASDCELSIVVDSPKRKQSRVKKPPDLDEAQLIQTLKDQNVHEILEEKAVKNNLTPLNVKSIIKEVVQNVHVVALMKENSKRDPKLDFGPRLTRSKAKEVFHSQLINSHPLLIPKKTPPSEMQQLINKEFAEDSSGDEYVPGEESEDDRDSSVISETELRSISPMTPLREPDSPVHWTDDGIFKIPSTKAIENKSVTVEDVPAKNTRSKQSLNDIAMETLESSFLPPDITPDMYEMECDNELWSDFLRMLNSTPLDEMPSVTEDEEHDPSYNILADEQINMIDDIEEELRRDKAVNVPRKELNQLIAELCDYVDFTHHTQFSEPSKNQNSMNSSQQTTLLETTVIPDNSILDMSINNNLVTQLLSVTEPSPLGMQNENMTIPQKLLFDQQLRQHVQLLAQNFILTYKHPEFHAMSVDSKEMLTSLDNCASKNEIFKALNLNSAMKLVEEWTNKIDSDDDEVKKMFSHIIKDIHESKTKYSLGVDYVVQLPTLMLKVISNSDAFVYTNMLPKIPYKSDSVFPKTAIFVRSEDELIAIGMEQFIPHLSKDPHHLNLQGGVKLKSLCYMLHTYILQVKSPEQLNNRIYQMKCPRTSKNAIKYYYENKRAPVTTHYVVDMQNLKILPPCKRDKNDLPFQFKQYLYPDNSNVATNSSSSSVSTVTKVLKPPPALYSKGFKKRRSITRSSDFHLFPEGSSSGCKTSTPAFRLGKRPTFCSTPKTSFPVNATAKTLDQYFQSPTILASNPSNNSSCLKCMKFNSSIFAKLKTSKPVCLFPDMMNLNGSNLGNGEIGDSNKDVTSTVCSDKSAFSNGDVVVFEDDEAPERDNADDINALMVASAFNKNTGARKSLTGAEKRKAKLLKDSAATLNMLAPEDPTIIQEKAQSYAQAYFDKARERLSSDDYNRFMDVFTSFGEENSNVFELYKQVELVFKDQTDLIEEFLTFLTAAQAREVGKLIPYYMLSNMSLFLHKLELYFKDQPSQLRKIYRSLSDLSSCVNMTMDRVKNSILPLLKGNNLLTDWFLQIFPSEPPPESLLRGPWEQVELKRNFESMNKELSEVVVVPDREESFGVSNCTCNCHQRENSKFKSRLQHCLSCGIRFLQGRVYVQTSKGLRLANVTFDNSSEIDHHLRLNCSPDKKKRRCDSSPSKQIPLASKECQDENKLIVDSEDDDCAKRKNRTKPSRKKRVKLTTNKEEKLNDSKVTSSIPILENGENVEISNKPVVTAHDEPAIIEAVAVQDNQVNSAEDNYGEWDCNTSIESIELRMSPEPGGDSEIEFCEESSQDNVNTESDDSEVEEESLSNSPVHSENSNSNNMFETVSWTREEDKIILETLQKDGHSEESLHKIAGTLSNRSVAQVKERLDTLLLLMQKMKKA